MTGWCMSGARSDLASKFLCLMCTNAIIKHCTNSEVSIIPARLVEQLQPANTSCNESFKEAYRKLYDNRREVFYTSWEHVRTKQATWWALVEASLGVQAANSPSYIVNTFTMCINAHHSPNVKGPKQPYIHVCDLSKRYKVQYTVYLFLYFCLIYAF